ncbi:MAG: hypothetical protein ABIG84_02090, partial [archaeon]
TIDVLAGRVLESYIHTKERESKDPAWKNRIYTNRKKLARHIEAFHRNSGTLTEGVKEKIGHLCDKKDCIFLMTAHQTNFLPYSGIIRKTTLMHAIKEKLKGLCGTEVIEFYGIANQDMASSWPWLRTTQLPSVFHKNGIFELSHDQKKEFDMKIHAAVPKPERHDIGRWGAGIKEWMSVCQAAIESHGHKISPQKKKELYRNYEDFMELMNKSNDRARNFAEFNAISLSKIVNDHFHHDTLFSLFTDSQKIFDREFLFLLENHKAYHSCLGSASRTEDCAIAPFWYHCECLGKVGLMITETKTSLELSGKCPSCSKIHAFRLEKDNSYSGFRKISNHISARARPMTLVFFHGLAANMYVGGALANKCYLKDAERMAEKMDLNFPPVAVWRPRERYDGLGQLSCELIKKSECDGHTLEGAIRRLEDELSAINTEIEKLDALIRRTTSAHERMRLIAEKNSIRKNSNTMAISKKISCLKKIPGTESVIPSILDYAINIGLKKTRDGWLDHLLGCGDLKKELALRSIIGRGNGDETQ